MVWMCMDVAAKTATGLGVSGGDVPERNVGELEL
jgi:hypothetical protein